MNFLLLLIVVSSLGAMVLWSIHIDRRRSQRDLRKEEHSVAAACKKWVTEKQNSAE